MYIVDVPPIILSAQIHNIKGENLPNQSLPQEYLTWHISSVYQVIFFYVPRGPGGIFWPKTHSDTHLEHPEKVVSLTERGRKRVKEWRQATFMKEGMKALEKTRILAPADLRYLFSFPRYGRLKLTFLPDQFLHSKI